MRVVLILLQVIGGILLLLFMLLDWLVIDLPKEYMASRWRKRAKVGDKCYFINLLGNKTVGTIEEMLDDKQAYLHTRNSRGTHDLRNLYPAGEDDY